VNGRDFATNMKFCNAMKAYAKLNNSFVRSPHIIIIIVKAGKRKGKWKYSLHEYMPVSISM